MSNTTTAFSDKCNILSDLWLNYKDDPEFEDFVEYNDIGLPLAFCITHEIVTPTDIATGYVNEAWDLLLEAVGAEDTGYATLDEILMRDFWDYDQSQKIAKPSTIIYLVCQTML